ncbi:MAG: L,D-transpeptidase family protein, partial [Candidatus Sumerlaeota bacterium]
EEHPSSAHIPRALVKLGEAAYDAQRDEEAKKYFQMLVEKFPRSEFVDDAKFGLIRLAHLERGRMATRDALRALLKEYPASDRADEIETILATINMDLLFSPSADQTEEVTVYTVKSGDTLSGIGRRFDISPELLMEINRIKNSQNLPIGKRLFIPDVDFSIVVNKEDNSLVLYNKGEFFKRYPVRTGKRELLTPTDTFRIQSKTKDPEWKKPSGATYAPGDPENALGSRWMAFDASSGLGIHGTNKPETIGTYASEGCVGMYNEDVEELFNLVPIGTPIEITGKKRDNGKEERL